MFKFITERSFFVNLLAAIALALLLVFSFLQMLSFITKHGEYLTVPSLVGKDTQEAIKLLEKQGFEVMIQDSVYTDTVKRGTVIKQLPDENSTVKINRTVFLTVNRYVPPMVAMPKLEGLTLRFALELLQRNHLELGDTTYKPDFMKGSVLEQRYNGSRILPGNKIKWGSRIDLVIGSGLSGESLLVPELTGLRYDSAKALLEQNGIGIGALILEGNVTDTAAAYIIRQNPEVKDAEDVPQYIQSGQLMDLWLSPVMIDIKKDSTKK